MTVTKTTEAISSQGGSGARARALPLASGGDLQPGQIQFYESIQPPLPSASYQLVANQTIKLTAEAPVYTSKAEFAINGPRFRLQANQVQQVYPPANQNGVFYEVLPHVVLRDRTLPWSRTIDGSVTPAGTVSTPWVALLTLYPADLNNGAISVQTGTVGAFLTAATNVITPNIPLSGLSVAQQAEPVLYIELPQTTFFGIAPTLLDLPYLSHARQVNTGNKEILGMDADGYFSVVVGNRLPQTQAGTTTENTVLLVSLEGLSAQLPVDDATPPPASSTVVRLAVLASWTFQCSATPLDFAAVMAAVDATTLLNLPYTVGATPTAEQAIASEALGWGYVPLENNTRSGEQTTSWYRGPCVPVWASADPYGPYLFSDAAVRYDSGATTATATGMFDLSYACAWQIGRLTALADGAFSKTLMSWRQNLAAVQNDQSAAAAVSFRFASVTGSGTTAEAQAALFPDASEVEPGGSRLTLRTGRSAVSIALMKLGNVSTQLPKKVPHEERMAHTLPGVLSEPEMEIVFSEPGDPLANLLRHAFSRQTEGGSK